MKRSPRMRGQQVSGDGCDCRSNAVTEGFSAGHRPVRNRSRIVASMVRQRDCLMLSHLGPIPFPRVAVHDDDRRLADRTSNHINPMAVVRRSSWAKAPLVEGVRRPTMMGRPRVRTASPPRWSDGEIDSYFPLRYHSLSAFPSCPIEVCFL